MARHFDEHFLDDDQPDRYHELRGEHVNIRAALHYALGDVGDYDDYDDQGGHGGHAASPEVVERWRRGCLLAVKLSPYWQISGLLNEGRHWLDKALSAFSAPSPERALALGIRGRLATFHGDLGSALADIRESIKVAEETGEQLAAGRGYFYLNLALTFAGQHAEALIAGQTARERMTAGGDHIGLACLWPQLAHLHQLAGHINAAIECCERGLEKLAEFGQPGPERRERWISSYLYLISGFALFQLPGRGDDCAVATRRALRAKHDLGDEVGIAFSLEVLGWLAARGSRFEQAAWLLGAADPIWQRTASRLSNIAIMERTHQRVVGQAREAIGGPRYESVHAQGAGLALDDVVAHAIDGGDAAPWSGVGGSRSDGRYGRDSRGAAGVTPITTASLTKREREIAVLVASGLSNREIATRLYISKRTVDAHVEHIFAKLDISSRVKLTMWLQSQVRVGA